MVVIERVLEYLKQELPELEFFIGTMPADVETGVYLVDEGGRDPDFYLGQDVFHGRKYISFYIKSSIQSTASSVATSVGDVLNSIKQNVEDVLLCRRVGDLIYLGKDELNFVEYRLEYVFLNKEE